MPSRSDGKGPVSCQLEASALSGRVAGWGWPVVGRAMAEQGISVVDQLSTLIGVVVGAAMSYVVGTLHERTRWRRQQGARWDGLLLQAYSDYGQAIMDCVVVYQRLAAHQGLTEDPSPVETTGDALEEAARAELRRAAMTEPLRLLADPDTAAAVRKLNDAVWHLEWLARGG